jgi:hypothetical protein
VYLLEEEFKPAAVALAAPQERRELPEVAAQPGDLLGDVAAVGEMKNLAPERLN